MPAEWRDKSARADDCRRHSIHGFLTRRLDTIKNRRASLCRSSSKDPVEGERIFNALAEKRKSADAVFQKDLLVTRFRHVSINSTYPGWLTAKEFTKQ